MATVEHEQSTYKDGLVDAILATGLGGFLGALGGGVIELGPAAILRMTNIVEPQAPSVWLILPAGLAVIGAGYFFTKEIEYIKNQRQNP